MYRRAFCSLFGIDDIALALGASAIIGAGSSAYAAGEAREGAEDANRMAIDLARENREWQERMSNTAHQREVKDLREAGLNPILSARLGGASSPAGNVPNIVNERAQSSQMQAAAAEKLASTPLAIAQLDNIQAQTAKTIQDTSASAAAERLTNAQTWATDTNSLIANTQLQTLPTKLRQDLERGGVDIKEVLQRTSNLAVDNRLKELSIPSAKAAAALGKVDEEFYSSAPGRLLRLGELGADALNPFVNSADAVSRMRHRHTD